MKKLLSLLLAVLMVVSLSACGKKEETPTDTPDAAPTTDVYEVAVVTDVGQLNDGGFNQYTFEGAKLFAEANGYNYNYYAPANGTDATDNDRIDAMRLAIENGAKVIVTPGFMQATALQTVAAESPDVKFVFVDGWALGLPNVTAISYKEQEAGYFAGYAAAKDGYTKLAGTFGGAGTNAACNRYAYGYVQGIEAAAAELGTTCDVTISFLYGAAFSASTELQTQVSGWYNNGTEVVFSCGGSMLQSVKAAAAETQNGKIIGVDVDQASESDRVITSACKGLSASVQLVLTEWNNGEWDAKLADQCSVLGAAENSTEIPTASGSWRFNTFTVDEYKALFDKVVAGEVTPLDNVSDNMSTQASWDALTADFSHVNLTVEE
jgi:basic membrane protein A